MEIKVAVYMPIEDAKDHYCRNPQHISKEIKAKVDDFLNKNLNFTLDKDYFLNEHPQFLADIKRRADTDGTLKIKIKRFIDLLGSIYINLEPNWCDRMDMQNILDNLPDYFEEIKIITDTSAESLKKKTYSDVAKHGIEPIGTIPNTGLPIESTFELLEIGKKHKIPALEAFHRLRQFSDQQIKDMIRNKDLVEIRKMIGCNELNWNKEETQESIMKGQFCINVCKHGYLCWRHPAGECNFAHNPDAQYFGVLNAIEQGTPFNTVIKYVKYNAERKEKTYFNLPIMKPQYNQKVVSVNYQENEEN